MLREQSSRRRSSKARQPGKRLLSSAGASPWMQKEISLRARASQIKSLCSFRGGHRAEFLRDGVGADALDQHDGCGKASSCTQSPNLDCSRDSAPPKRITNLLSSLYRVASGWERIVRGVMGLTGRARLRETTARPRFGVCRGPRHLTSKPPSIRRWSDDNNVSSFGSQVN